MQGSNKNNTKDKPYEKCKPLIILTKHAVPEINLMKIITRDKPYKTIIPTLLISYILIGCLDDFILR